MPSGLANQALEVIKFRTSVREFRAEPIPQEVLAEIVECGLRAPSSKNAQPWMLHVVTDKTVLRGIARAVRQAEGKGDFVPHNPKTGLPRDEYHSTVDESAHSIAQAAASICIENSGKFSESRATIANIANDIEGALVGMGLEYIGLGACVENMWLAAGALGVQATFAGDVLIVEDYIKSTLGMEGDLVGVLSLGYSDVEQARKPTNFANVVYHD
jgi:nitroreductase